LAASTYAAKVIALMLIPVCAVGYIHTYYPGALSDPSCFGKCGELQKIVLGVAGLWALGVKSLADEGGRAGISVKVKGA